MNWYKNNKIEWKEIIQTVAAEIKRDPILVEKDTVQSMFLFELMKTDLPLVFKGGTSLSKAYKLIDRFSEDLDLSSSCALTDSKKREIKAEILTISKSWV